MRHKTLCLGMKFLGPRVMLALQVWLWLLLFIFQNEFRISFAAEPGYLDFDNLPETNFSCTGKVIGGYYADLETDCQMFHVCTIGQLEEPMDIKFLCLNGTVFDQETRVCERVDEVDCSKSEHFYSLNLELYGNTAPPIIKAETLKNADEEIDGDDEEYDDLDDNYETTTTHKPITTTSSTTTTEKSTPSSTNRPTPKITYYQTTYKPSQDVDDDDEEDYDLPEENSSNKTSILSKPQVNVNVDSQVPKPLPKLIQKNTLNSYGISNNEQDAVKPTEISDNSQIFSPQQFIYHHNNHEPKSPAISFQQHSYTSNGQNSHVTVTTHTGRINYNPDNSNSPASKSENSQNNKGYLSSSTPQSVTKIYSEKTPSFNNYQTFNSPKRIPLIPPSSQIQPPTGHPGLPAPKHQKETIQFYNFNKPQGFKPSPSTHNYKPSATTPRNNQNYQPSERLEVALDNDYDFEKLSPDFPYIHQDFSHYHYDKRSQDANKYDLNLDTDKTTEAKITTTTPYYNTWATRNNNYTKSLPRVIVTASASVSDSNGKKLNYTVGNIVHAVKPLVPTNYDDYKESDVLLDPFFLDVPKLKKDRRKRSDHMTQKLALARGRRETVIKVYKYDAESKVTELTSPIEKFDKIYSDPKKTFPTKSSSEIPESSIESKLTIETIDSRLGEPTKPSLIIENLSQKWIPPDYVDDNYEPIVYQEPEVVHIEDDHTKLKHNKSAPIPLLSISELKIKCNNSKNVNSYSKLEKGDVKIKLINGFTTENNIAKTTLDMAKIEDTTVAFMPSDIPKKKESKNYKLISVHGVNMSDKLAKHSHHVCNDKKYYKFYPDKTNCRTFYMCLPGKVNNEVLNVLFICDLGMYFDGNTNCTSHKPNNCES